MVDRYSVSPTNLEGKADVVTYIQDLFRRMGDTDTALRIGHTAIEDGNLTVRNGDIIVSETDDTVVLRIKHGATPEIDFYPLGETDTHQGVVFAQDFNNDPSNPNQAIQMDIELLDNTIDGGKVLLTRTEAIIAHQPDGGEECFIWLNALAGISEEIIDVRGRFPDQSQRDSHTGLYMGAFTATAGFSTWTHTYFTPFATTIVPVVTVGVNGGTLTWGLDSYSTSNFVIRFGVTANNKMVTFWAFRI